MALNATNVANSLIDTLNKLSNVRSPPLPAHLIRAVIRVPLCSRKLSWLRINLTLSMRDLMIRLRRRVHVLFCRRKAIGVC